MGDIHKRSPKIRTNGLYIYIYTYVTIVDIVGHIEIMVTHQPELR